MDHAIVANLYRSRIMRALLKDHRLPFTPDTRFYRYRQDTLLRRYEANEEKFIACFEIPDDYRGTFFIMKESNSR